MKVNYVVQSVQSRPGGSRAGNRTWCQDICKTPFWGRSGRLQLDL